MLSTKHKDKILLSSSVLGFIVTGLLCAPFGVDWDSSHVISSTVLNNVPCASDWLGWLFPGIIFVLYKMSGQPQAIGVFQNLIYWIGVTIMAMSLFRKRRHYLLWYSMLAFFPGSLAFITSITNNALLFASMLLGVSLFMSSCKIKRNKTIEALSFVIVFLTVFIRREAIAFSSVVLVFMTGTEIYWHFKNEWSKWKVGAIAIAIPVAVLSASLTIEKALTERMRNYHKINSFDYIALYDMEAMSQFKKDVVIPVYIFKRQYRNRDFLLQRIQDDAETYEDVSGCFWNYGDYLTTNPFLVKIDNKASIYLENAKYWFMSRLRLFKDYMYTSFVTVYGGGINITNAEGTEQSLLSKFFAETAVLLGTVWNFFLLAIVMTVVSAKGIIPFGSKTELYLITTLWLLLLGTFFLYIFSAVSIQIRYLFPTCIFLFYLLVYSMSLFVEKNRFVRTLQQ